MRTEIPVCKRCCFCLPLRYGLIVWGYLRLCISITLLIALGFIWNAIFARHIYSYYESVYCVATTLSISDFVLTLIFIVGCHKKNAKLMRVFYIYSQVLLGLTTAYTLFIIAWLIIAFIRYTYNSEYYSENGFLEFGMFIGTESLVYFAHLFLQLYMILLVRSEIVKLNNGCQFRFVNHANEAQCTLDVTLATQRLPHENDPETC